MKNFIKSTIIGGLIFLIPVVIIALILSEAVNLVMIIAEPIDEFLPVDFIGAFAVVNIVAVSLVILVCFIAGMIAKSSFGNKSFEYLDSKLITIFPGYSFLKAITGSFDDKSDLRYLKPVILKYDEYSQIAFEVSRNNDGIVVAFIPLAPNPWTGSVIYISEERVEHIDCEFTDIMRSLGMLGKDSEMFTTNTTLLK